MSTILAVLDVAIVPILVALIALIPHTIKKFRKENNTQHSSTSSTLQLILDGQKNLDEKIDRVESKIDRHLGEHDGAAARVPVPMTRRKAANR